MNPFLLKHGVLHAEDVPLPEIAARFGTPTYVYSKAAILQAFAGYQRALQNRPALVCYAVKANPNLAILNLLAQQGAGFDIVSGGELARVLAAGGDARKVVFSGVGKREIEIEAALKANILCFNIESVAELDRIDAVAKRMGEIARISVRINPDVDPKTHPYISTGLKQNKFGVAYHDARALYEDATQRQAIQIIGIDCHIGSQITHIEPYLDALDRLLDMVDLLTGDGITLQHLDLGGGLGIDYQNSSPDELPPATEDFVHALLQRLDVRGHGDKTVLFEPGRSIVGKAGVLLSRVEFLKPGETKNFAIVDAAMNDLMRPAMYQAWMAIREVSVSTHKKQLYDVVGPVCESGDWLARERELAIAPGDLIVVMDAGAYGMSMASNYNTRGRPAEVIVDGKQMFEVRRRETVQELFGHESVLPSI